MHLIITYAPSSLNAGYISVASSAMLWNTGCGLVEAAVAAACRLHGVALMGKVYSIYAVVVAGVR